jgi:hypothetical protein
LGEFRKLRFFFSLFREHNHTTASNCNISSHALQIICHLVFVYELDRSLDVELSVKVMSVGFEALSKLRHLRQVFLQVLSSERHLKWMLLCVRWLPHLRLVSRPLDCRRSDASLKNFFHDQLLEPREAQQLHLEEMGLGMCDVDCAVNCKLPELRALHLYYAMGDVVGLCERLPNKLDTLCFYNAEQDLIERVLQRVGVRMRSLKISDARPQLLLGQVVGLCPNLQSLSLQCDSNDMFGACLLGVSLLSKKFSWTSARFCFSLDFSCRYCHLFCMTKHLYLYALQFSQDSKNHTKNYHLRGWTFLFSFELLISQYMKLNC